MSYSQFSKQTMNLQREKRLSSGQVWDKFGRVVGFEGANYKGFQKRFM